MASYTADEILGASMPVQLGSHHIARPSTFLSLAPTTSASYPRQRTSPPASVISPKIEAVDAKTAAPAAAAVAANTDPTASPATAAAVVPETAPLAAVEELDASGQPKHRRSSSLASDESGNAKLRFLKLGPVHWGEGDGKGDWSESGVNE